MGERKRKKGERDGRERKRRERGMRKERLSTFNPHSRTRSVRIMKSNSCFSPLLSFLLSLSFSLSLFLSLPYSPYDEKEKGVCVGS